MGREVFIEVHLQRRGSTMWLHTLGVFAHCVVGYARFLFALEGVKTGLWIKKSLSALSKEDGEASLNWELDVFRSSEGQNVKIS